MSPPVPSTLLPELLNRVFRYPTGVVFPFNVIVYPAFVLTYTPLNANCPILEVVVFKFRLAPVTVFPLKLTLSPFNPVTSPLSLMPFPLISTNAVPFTVPVPVPYCFTPKSTEEGTSPASNARSTLDAVVTL